jgi:hypothetical protein
MIINSQVPLDFRVPFHVVKAKSVETALAVLAERERLADVARSFIEHPTDPGCMCNLCVLPARIAAKIRERK